MSDRSAPPSRVLDNAPGWLARLGVRSWLIVGCLALVGVAAWLLSLSSTIVVPFLLAVILGILFQPVVGLFERLRLPRAAAAGVTMLLVLLVLVGVVWLIVQSVGGQFGTITSQVTLGLGSLSGWLKTLDIPQALIDKTTTAVQAQLPKVGTSIANVVFSGLTGAAGLLFGAFIGFYMLFYTLADWPKISAWAGHNLGLPNELGSAVVADASSSVQQYFQGTTVLAIITSLGTGIGLAFARVPLVIPIMVVTFLLTYIPYFGAIVSSAFTVLIALGAGGVEMALIALVIVLLAQNVLQGAFAGWAIGGALDLHPLVVIMATMLGGIFGGLLGGMLGAPIAAILVRLTRRLRDANLEGATPTGLAEVVGS